MTRGTIVLTKFPFSNLKSSKRRPAVILSSKSKEGDFIVAFISSKIPEENPPSYIIIKKSEADFSSSGLKVDSVVRTDKLATLNTTVFAGELGFFSSRIMKKIEEGLKISLGIQN